MDTVIPGLHASAPQTLSFAPSLETRSFLLEREAGNVLVYRPDALEGEVHAINDLGGIARQYLNHRHEASPVSDWVAETFGARLFVHEAEAPSVSEAANVDETFSSRHRVNGNFEVIPSPGHTAGATSFRWVSGEHRALFTGDTVFLRDGEWVAAVLGFSDRESYVQSLELIRGLEFDVLVPWAATVGGPYYSFVDKTEAERRIDAILQRVRRGEDG